MPVYNAGEYLRAAMESVLKQTYTDFEFIIINDGSKDNSADIIQSYKDTRIKFFTQENHGLTKTLNRLISLAQGMFIARMDQDDWSYPTRLANQVAFLNNNTVVGLVGTWVEVIDPQGTHLRVRRYPVCDGAIKELMLLKNPFAHGSIMMRKSLQAKYETEYDYAEDFGLWSKLAQTTQLANLPKVLYKWRTSQGGMTNKFASQQAKTRRHILNQYRRFYLNAYQAEMTMRNDGIEVVHRGKLRVMFVKLALAVHFLISAKFSWCAKKILEAGLIFFTRKNAKL